MQVTNKPSKSKSESKPGKLTTKHIHSKHKTRLQQCTVDNASPVSVEAAPQLVVQAPGSHGLQAVQAGPQQLLA